MFVFFQDFELVPAKNSVFVLGVTTVSFFLQEKSVTSTSDKAIEMFLIVIFVIFYLI
jgi:hypothetical protein